ncbi:short spindle 6 [Aphomia sociella]
MSSPKLNERCPSSLSNGKKLLSNDSKEDSLDNSLREPGKSERPGGKGEEDWRRRTIIVEKKNGNYGFTLQSYGIHYKKEQEIEVITYVDHVEGDGPAAAAGMREGDVILSINGADVERADHAVIVDAINACDSRMRMVVIFEDCVRKVELHLKYINLQRAIQSKMRELDQLTVRERQLFDSNWKTHSLPSQKKKNSPADVISDSEENNIGDNVNNAYCRPTLSSENVTAAKPPHANVFMYQYLDPHYGTCLIQPNIHTGSFVITVGSPRNRRDCHHYVVKTPGECHRASDGHKTSNGKHSKVHRNNHSHSCTPCVPNYNNQDANSLEAYDLASPCCDPHCVPNTRKKIRRKKECSKEHKRKEKSQQVDKSTQKPDGCSHARTKKVCPSGHCSSRYRYLATESTQTSQCSLQSYATSNATVPCDNSASSYSTSLSSDTLFWDNDRLENKSSPKIQYQSSHQHVKPKSWDNLTTKAFGGYGFGYGYLDTSTKHSNRSKSHGRSHSGRSTQSHHEYQHHSQEKHSHRQSATPHHYSVYSRSHSRCAPTKSTESLIVVPKYQLESSGSESRLACDCNESIEYYRRISINKSSGDGHSTGYYSQHFIYPTHSYKKKDSNVSSEITRL